MKTKLFYGLFFILLAIALVFRVTGLNLRPMHHDEANQAVKFGRLLEEGTYVYDKTDHHGPTLYYAALPIALAASGRSFERLKESTLRLVPALFGVAFLALLLIVRNDLGRGAVLIAGVLAAVSPVMTYYSRFFIQESLFVFFIWLGIFLFWKYLRQPSGLLALFSGMAFGLVYATKETSVLVFAALAGAYLLFRLLGSSQDRPRLSWRSGFLHTCLGLGGAGFLSFLFFSSFFSNLPGFLDSFRAFGPYLAKAETVGIHAHPWHYYLHMLAFFKLGTGPALSEGLILILALAGVAAAFLRKSSRIASVPFVRFTVYFTLILTVIYSAIRYKTPWNLLPFYSGLVLLAGYGGAWLIGSMKSVPFKILVIALLASGISFQALQSYRANFVFYADPHNPYVYAQTSKGFMNLVQLMDELAAFHSDHKNMLIAVVSPPDETWPLPWYLRGYHRVGYWTNGNQPGIPLNAPVIISSAENEAILTGRLLQPYQTEYYGLRPEILLAVHIRLDFWNQFIRHRQDP